jgi:predicted RNA methylase
LFAGKTCRTIGSSTAALSTVRIVSVDRDAEELEAALKRNIKRNTVLTDTRLKHIQNNRFILRASLTDIGRFCASGEQ